MTFAASRRVNSRRAIPRLTAVAATCLLAGGLALAQSASAAADNSSIPPTSLSSTATAPAVLQAGGAQSMSSGLTRFTSQPDAYYWINNFNAAGTYVSWNVSSDATANYNVVAVLSSQDAAPFTVSDLTSGSSATATSATYGWDRLSVGTISIPAGSSQIKFSRSTTSPTETDVKSIELIPTAEQATYNASVAASKADGQWMTDDGYGLFFQYGPWGYPNPSQGSTQETPYQQACGFNVANFVKMVQSTGAQYVIWSYTWYTYQVDGPNTAIDAITGTPGSNTITDPTCPDGHSSDLDLSVIQALHAAGIRTIMYYHNGHDQDANWWAKQQYPAGYQQTGTGDKSTFLSNWKKVIGYIGNHFGTALDGFMFDDATYYYPANFADLEATARIGNPNRIITYNNWVSAPVTQYQDYLGTDNGVGACSNNGAPVAGYPVGGDGVITSGPSAGMRSNCEYLLDQDWGIYQPNTTIQLTKSVPQVENDLDSATANHTSLTFAMMMYQDGSVDPATLSLLQQVKQHYRGGTVNDTDSSFQYGSGWAYSSGRSEADLDNDVHYTSTTGATATVSFYGTGATLLGPTYPGSSSGTVSVDGNAAGTFTENKGSGYVSQAPVFSINNLSRGYHTITVKNNGDGNWLQLDGLTTTVAPTDDTANTVAYSSGWTASTGRGLGDINDSVHTSQTSGSTATLQFYGTGVDVLGPTSQNAGGATVSIDGSNVGTVTENVGTSYKAARTIGSYRGLRPGPHTMTLTTTGSSAFSLDALRPVNDVINDSSPLINFGGSWNYAQGRTSGDIGSDVHYTTAGGSTMSVTFSGTGITVYGPTFQGGMSANVVLDGAAKGSVSENSSSSYTGAQPVFQVSNLTAGSHTLTLTSVAGGSFFQIDGLRAIG